MTTVDGRAMVRRYSILWTTSRHHLLSSELVSQAVAVENSLFYDLRFTRSFIQ